MEEGLEKVEITWGRVAKVWWCLLWRTYLDFLVIIIAVWGIRTLIAFCVASLIGELTNETKELITTPCNAVGTLLLIYISFVVVRFIFKKKFSDFRIVLVKQDRKPKDEQKQ
jgi:hypothetical protein